MDVTNDSQNVSQTLQAKRQEVLKKINIFNSEISSINAEYKSKLSRLQEQKKPLEETLFHLDALLKLDGKIENSTDGNSAINGSLNDSAFVLLEQIHEPTHYREITRKLQESGIHIAGKNPEAILLARISRDKRFKHAKGRGLYALSTWRIRRKRSKSSKKRK